MVNTPQIKRELSLDELNRVNGGSAAGDFGDLVKLVIHILTGGPVTQGKGLR
jgi:hypothetical protein